MWNSTSLNYIMCMSLLQIINQDPTKVRGEFEDTSQVEKYEISQQEYAKRTGAYIIMSIMYEECNSLC